MLCAIQDPIGACCTHCWCPITDTRMEPTACLALWKPHPHCLSCYYTNASHLFLHPHLFLLANMLITITRKGTALKAMQKKAVFTGLRPDLLSVSLTLPREQHNPGRLYLESLRNFAGDGILVILQGHPLSQLCLGSAVGEGSCSSHGKESVPCAGLLISAMPAAGD